MITFPHKIRDVDRDQLDQHSCTLALESHSLSETLELAREEGRV